MDWTRRDGLWTHWAAGWLRLVDVQIEENVSLAPFTTLKIGGAARFFLRATREMQIMMGAAVADQKGLPLFVLGGGSNLVVADEGFNGVVVQVAIDTPPAQIEVRDGVGSSKFARCLVPAGLLWDDFVRFACEQGMSGIECLAGIPGLVGGTPVQNIGAYGQEVSSTIVEVHAIDLEDGLCMKTLSAEECGFGYRRSIFNSTQRGRYAITRVLFDLPLNGSVNLKYSDLQKHFEGNPEPSPLEVYEAVRAIRAVKGMLIDTENPSPDSRSAGSFFKNPIVTQKKFVGIAETILEADKIPHWPDETGDVKLAAAWLIEQAGFRKGFALGRVGISSKHTLALINRTGDASCAELLQLRDLIVLTVEQRFGVTLEMEPVMLG